MFLKNRMPVFIVISIIILVIMISGCTSNDKNTSNKVFDNQYVKFQIPNGLTVTDNSTDTNLDLTFMKGSEMIGDMGGLSINPDTYNNLVVAAPDEYKKTIIAGKDAIEYKNSYTIGAYIPTGETNSIGYYLGVSVDFDIPYSSEYYIIRNSLMIKKTPT